MRRGPGVVFRATAHLPARMQRSVDLAVGPPRSTCRRGDLPMKLPGDPPIKLPVGPPVKLPGASMWRVAVVQAGPQTLGLTTQDNSAPAAGIWSVNQ